MVEINIPNNWISNFLKVGGVLVVLIMVATLIKPSITGNVVNRMNELSVNLTACSEDLSKTYDELSANELMVSNLQSDISDISAQNNDCQNTRTAMQQELDKTKSDLGDTVDDLSKLELKYATLIEKINDSRQDYSDLAEYAARVRCCFLRVEDSDIESYDVKDNKIICKTGSKGEYTLDCEN